MPRTGYLRLIEMDEHNEIWIYRYEHIHIIKLIWYGYEET